MAYHQLFCLAERWVSLPSEMDKIKVWILGKRTNVVSLKLNRKGMKMLCFTILLCLIEPEKKRENNTFDRNQNGIWMNWLKWANFICEFYSWPVKSPQKTLLNFNRMFWAAQLKADFFPSPLQRTRGFLFFSRGHCSFHYTDEALYNSNPMTWEAQLKEECSYCVCNKYLNDITIPTFKLHTDRSLKNSHKLKKKKNSEKRQKYLNMRIVSQLESCKIMLFL